MDDTLSGSADYLLINHSDGREERFVVPSVLAHAIGIGRETDNDVALNDPRVSRHHSQIRRGVEGLEIRDLGSANGTVVGDTHLQANVWQPLPAGTTVHLGDTSLVLEVGIHKATTIAIAPVLGAPVPSAPPSRVSAFAPWLLIGGALVVVAVLIAVAVVLWPAGEEGQAVPAEVPAATAPLVGVVSPAAPPTAEYSSGEGVPRVPYPVVDLESVTVEPIILGALPDPTKAFIVVEVRVENHGVGDFTVAPDQFVLVDVSGTVLPEVGVTYSASGLRKLGLADRYQNLRLGPGDSVPESLLFSGDARRYELFLRYQPPDLEPIMLDLGVLDTGRAVALALGTPVVEEETPVALAQATLTVAPSPTSTRRPESAAPKIISTSSLVGTIAYPVFNGETYDLYLGNADGSGSWVLLGGASQPQFSPDGQRLAYHSWLENKRGLITVDVSGGNEHLIADHLEDQLPTWSPDGGSIIFLTRRTGHRASELFRVPSVGGDDEFVGNGEYPTWGATGQLAFKGWDSTGVGLRLAQPDFSDIQALSDDETDTAPAISPDGKRIAFMSRRYGNWNIYVVGSDGKGLKQLTEDSADDGLPAWSPDGKVIAFVSNRGGPWAVWAMNPDGGGSERQLFTMEGSPDGFVAGEDLDKSRGWAEERISWAY
ncbi:MAG: PD40 domain-containing protein [Ardenticatenia bacterium]|nr:PD40 domain-containing protein [Ardenticatenia bacterium]